MNWYQKIIFAYRATYISPDEFFRRLKVIGWDIVRRQAKHFIVFAPNGKDRIALTASEDSWQRSWIVNRRRLLQISKDLEFVWENPFIIPEGFNPLTLKIEEKADTQSGIQKVYLESIPHAEIGRYSIDTGSKWERIVDIEPDYVNNKVVVMTETGNIEELPIRQPAAVKAASCPSQRYSLSV